MESERDLMLDGNAVAGDLQRIFGEDMTATSGACDHCGNVAAVGELLAFVGGPGVVLRCPVCVEVMVRIVQTPRGTLVDVRGTRHLRLPRA